MREGKAEADALLEELKERLEHAETSEEMVESLTDEKLELLEAKASLEDEVRRQRAVLADAADTRELLEESEEVLKEELRDALQAAEEDQARCEKLERQMAAMEVAQEELYQVQILEHKDQHLVLLE